MVLYQLLERARVVALQELRADLVARLDHSAGFARVAAEVFIEAGGLWDRDAIEVVHHPQRPIERRVRCVEPQEQAEGLPPLLSQPLDRLAGQEVIDVLIVAARWT
jgi:hypothetical protein